MAVQITEEYSCSLPDRFNDHPVMTTTLCTIAYDLLKKEESEAIARGEKFYIWFRGWGGSDGVIYGSAPVVFRRLEALLTTVREDKAGFIEKASVFRGANDASRFKTPETSYCDAVAYLEAVLKIIKKYRNNPRKIIAL